MLTRKFVSDSSHYETERYFVYVAAALVTLMFAFELGEFRLFEYGTSYEWRGLGPFINANHGGGFAALMAMWCLHCAQKTNGSSRLLAVFLAVGFCCLTGLSLSRGAILSLVFGLGVAMAIPIFSRRKLSKPSIITTGIVVVLLAGLVFWERESLVPILRELASLKTENGLSKVTPWRGVPELLMMYPLGTGVGGLYAVLPQLDVSITSSGRIFFLENQPLQLLSDWGLILGSGLLLGFFAVLMRVSKRPVVL